ncbi:UDP-glucose 4-epimerase GalE [Methylocaldum sp.]|uniref:UDP-glucose 4-epimerase GalE n=1 Tax=Methylocaldum sp. TaxID=1969727 RepID=UPI002D48A838|nr:UDP-glucose 4-epimerase GalE [Methylocaldum sp.]HYE35241.1 UDP-glucose 4-epimerase GalE [Methylocaldum sp.]
MEKAILVTGGAGYIGSHTAKALSQAGYLPITFDNLVYGHSWAVRWGPLFEADLANTTALQQVLRDYKVEGVIHFAAYAYVGESMAHPEKYFRNNVVNTLNLLEAMQAAGIRSIVFSSTCATYGLPGETPIPEDHRQHPINPYGESKLFIERVLHWHHVAHGLCYAALRYFNAAGADPDGEIGEDHDPETHLIPLAIETALGKRNCLDIFGTDYPTPDGTAIRDYIHVTDLATAHVRALEKLLAGSGGFCVNLGTGQGHSVRQVVETVKEIGGREVVVRESPRRPGDPPILVAAPTRAGQLLDWYPRYSDLSTIIKTAWDWHERQRRENESPRTIRN